MQLTVYCYQCDKMQNLPLEDISFHSYQLSKVVRELDVDGDLAAAWLEVASGIISVDFDSARYDYCALLCSPIGKYEAERTELLSRLVHQLTVLNFVWGALEETIRLIDPPDHPRYRGRINSACYYLMCEYGNSKLPYYDDVLCQLQATLLKIDYYREHAKEFKLKSHVDHSGVGISVVYKIRNHFAHGTLVMPNPDMEEDRDEPELDIELVELSSRIVLMTIQMLLLARIKDNNYEIDELRIDIDGTTLREHIRLIHVLNSNYINKDQLQLNF